MKPAAWISPGGILWERSIVVVFGEIRAMTALRVPTKLSMRPKSVVRVMDWQGVQIRGRRCAGRGGFATLGRWDLVRPGSIGEGLTTGFGV